MAAIVEKAEVSHSPQMLWESALSSLRRQGVTYPVTQLMQLSPLTLSNGTFVLGVGDRFFRDWIDENYRELMEDTLSLIVGATTKIGFEIVEQVTHVAPALPAISVNSIRRPTRLNKRFTFETYVVADSKHLPAAASYDRERFLAEELELREGLGYPPYVRLANVLVWGCNEDAVRTVAKGLYHDLSQLVAGKGAGWLVSPPTPCVLERLKGSWRYHVVVKAPLKGNIAECFASYFRERKPHHDVRVSIDIDPANLL